MIKTIINWHWINAYDDEEKIQRAEQVGDWLEKNCTKYSNKELKRIVIKALNDESYDLP